MQDLCVKKFVRGLSYSLSIAVYSSGFSQVLINEVQVQPMPDSINSIPVEYMSYCLDTTYGAEWVEIYNSSLCDTINLECFMLASRTTDSNYSTFSFPANTFLPPLSFFVIGGTNAPNVDFRVPSFCFTQNRCGVLEWSLANDYGWVGLYDPNGVVQDAVFWTQNTGENGELATNMAYKGQPCVPTSCTPDPLRPASDMSVGGEIRYAGKVPGIGLVIYRQTDGTGGWRTDGVPTPGSCNGICATPSTLALQISSFANETCLQGNGWAMVEYSGGAAPYDVDWSNQSNADSLTNLTAGCYRASVTDSLGCYRTDSICIINIGVPVDVSIIPPQSTIFKGESIQLDLVTPATLDSIFWMPSESLNCPDCPSPIASPLTLTTYIVDVVDADGCTGSDTATVAVLSDENSTFIPTAFTPNNDGLNDLLRVKSTKIRTLDFHVYDRWGTEVFSTNDVNSGWDGKDKYGKDVDVGIYVYYANLSFDNGKSKTLKGNVAVLR